MKTETELAALKKAVNGWIASCEKYCDLRQQKFPNVCAAYTCRNRICPDCPRDHSDSLQEWILQEWIKEEMATANKK